MAATCTNGTGPYLAIYFAWDCSTTYSQPYEAAQPTRAEVLARLREEAKRRCRAGWVDAPKEQERRGIRRIWRPPELVRTTSHFV